MGIRNAAMAVAKSQVHHPVLCALVVASPWVVWFAARGGLLPVFAAVTLGAMQYANWRRGGPMEQWYEQQVRPG